MARWHLPVSAVLKAEEARRAKCDVFSMGELERLEVGSRLGGVAEEMVLEPRSASALGAMRKMRGVTRERMPTMFVARG